ncbi:RIBOSE-5-PHOSPHATE ISOMERASE [Mycoplasmopsis pulmonis]|uniref:RIBOSE-5-PHOSPHATE ISOMERASE n=1 Tax=Mycoplasmopsis pulmonis (strain UAB CTIP) TaxID=272635 RepID=Q98PV7_MYCPU|nr:ribose 5-phosphate isomerase B [Mycoplasmopsis pulmonis]MDZ7293587.1 ribose 5-phosphate isomerase B [Mycoplasmopsis pulmonis]CAC13785.1 RIBOSE-5-PHOSPHATE ISOMERASE [Mycoplasmopsis pulmonis]VEU68373.1 ribose-5-phosphate isomerase B [Mycoplasmopsis pulmonis]
MKKIAIASDHAGYSLKESIKKHYKDQNYEVIDLGTNSEESTSYSEYGHKLAEYMQNKDNKVDFGIGICGTGLGISYALNRHEGIIAARVTSEEDAYLAKAHNNANVLALGSRQISLEKAVKIIDKYQQSSFEGGRHIPRIEGIEIKDCFKKTKCS